MSEVRIETELISSQKLKPGDLFSYCLPGYWYERLQNAKGVGEKLYVRTYASSNEDVPVYRIKIEKEYKNDNV